MYFFANLKLTKKFQVAQQCKENIYAIQTLKDFQYLDDNKDQGINVREKAKALVALLKDDERLRNERVRALKAKERFAQSAAGIGSDTVVSLSLYLLELAPLWWFILLIPNTTYIFIDVIEITY